MVFIETSFFLKHVYTLLSEEELATLENILAVQPESGALIPHGGGLRKVRWAAKGKGKRGGSRVIYYWAVSNEQILLLYIYGKNERDDLTADQIRVLRRIVQEEYP